MSAQEAPKGVPSGSEANRKSGWYRDRKTGQRRFWNGAAWTDLASAITPFTVDPEPVVAPPSAPPVARAQKNRNRTRAIVASAVVLLGVLAIVLAVVVDGGTTAPASRSAQTPSSSDASAGARVESTSTTILAPTTAPPTSVAAGLGVTTPTPVPVGVEIIGDSITVLAIPEIGRAFHHNNVSIDAVVGSRMADHLSTIDRIENRGIPKDWVIELGTNDAGNPPLNTNWLTDFSNEVAALQSQPCVVLVTVNPKLGSISTGINQAIAGVVASHLNFHSIDWGNIKIRKPQWLLPDALHPSTSGSAELARLEHRAILGCAG